MIKKLIYTELKSFKSKSTLRDLIIIIISISFPLIFAFGSVFSKLGSENLPEIVNLQMAQSLDNIFYIRISFSFYIFVAWIFIPRSFYGKKITGEIEAIISMGYSAKNIWIGKSIANIIVIVSCSLPILFLLGAGLKLLIYSKLNLFISFSPFGLLFLFVINPLIIFFTILIIGGIQLVTDNYMKPSFIIFIIGFLNMFTITLLKDLNSPQIKLLFILISLAVLIGLGVIVLLFSKRIKNENFTVSLFKSNTLLAKILHGNS